MYKIRKEIGLLVLCLLSIVNAYATDSLPNPLKEAALKNAVMDSLNKRYADIPGTGTQLFSRFGLNAMHPGARQQFMQYAGMQTMLHGLQDSAKGARFIDNKLRGFYALKPQSSLTLPGIPENKLRGISWQTIYSDTTAMMSGWWNEG